MITRIVWLGNLPEHSAAAARAYLESFGPIRRFHYLERAIPVCAIGYYEQFESAERALAVREPILTIGSGQFLIKANVANPLPALQVAISNVDYEVTEAEVLALCEQSGPVDQVRTPRGDAATGLAFVAFQEPEAVATCMLALTGYVFHGRPLSVREYSQTAKPVDREVSPDLPTRTNDGIVYSTPEIIPEARPTMPLRRHQAPEEVYTRRKGSRRRQDSK